MKAKDLGNKGEELAVHFLKEKGYTILYRNWRYQKNEVDIIASKDNLLVFVEVKTRSSLDFGLPQEFVKSSQIKRLIYAANAFIEQLNSSQEVRFDIIAIIKREKNYEIEHIEEAFFLL